MDAVWDRIDAELGRRGMTWADLGRAIGVTDQAMGHWKARGVPSRRHKAIADVFGWSVDRLVADDWTHKQHPSEGLSVQPVAQVLIHPRPDHETPTITREFMLSAADLPPRFAAAVPDDALAPVTPRGTEFIFSAAHHPADGVVVVVQASNGRRYVRLYFAGMGDEWEARARDPAHPSLNSVRDGLRLLAAATHRAGGHG